VDPKRIVEQGYDRLGWRYREWVATNAPDVRAWFLGQVLGRMPHGANVLELGCGGGVEAALLAADRQYTGIDLSAVQLGFARQRVPQGMFVRGDFTQVALRRGYFDAVVSLYTFNHVPRAELAPTFRRVSEWLRVGGRFMLSLGVGSDEGSVQEDWLGVPMFFASHEARTNDRLLREAGFDLELSEIREENEAGYGTLCFQWMIARKQG
jgi:cyclopropane fatty-acyl-phospholipid synthase-like methyltransferase